MRLNPNHPVTKSLEGQWHKVLALVMSKLKVDHVELTIEDMAELGNYEKAVVAQELNDVLHIRLVSMEEGVRLARGEGGLGH